MWEWTTETGKYDSMVEKATTYAVRRGGSFDSGTFDYSVSSRTGFYSADDCSVNIGFRVVLYLQ